jgi:hypothetical protein
MDHELEITVAFPGSYAIKNKVGWVEVHYGERILGVGMTRALE